MENSILSLPILMISMPGPLELVLILLVVLLLFGAKRLPEIARGMGEAIREFKKSISGNKDHKRDSDFDES
ncbi:MAG: twin-arginine translocase TatA/TatE family subunit [Desulfobacterales bacterium]|nr:twin-arginine translocase TatA/TatE family subunit [Desulfobacterales bacterium]